MKASIGAVKTIKKLVETALFLYALVVGTVSLVFALGFILDTDNTIKQKLLGIVVIALTLLVYFSGRFVRKAHSKLSPREFYYILYASTFSTLTVSLFVQLFVRVDERSLATILFPLMDAAYFYLFILVCLFAFCAFFAESVYVLFRFLMPKTKDAKYGASKKRVVVGLVFIVLILMVVLSSILTQQSLIALILKLTTTETYVLVFLFTVGSPLAYYINALYRGSSYLNKRD